MQATHLLECIALKNPVHAKYLAKLKFDSEDMQEFNALLSCYAQEGVSEEDLCASYLLLLEDALKQTRYFLKYGTYRYSHLKDVKAHVYDNPQYMQKYVRGIAISSYLWQQHIGIRKHFSAYIDQIYGGGGGTYLEIGPGHGSHFLKALKSGKFAKLTGIDLSPTSLDLSQRMVASQAPDLVNRCAFVHADFLSTNFNQKADLIVMGEVLEHVETPLLFLERAKDLLNPHGEVYATIPINAPMIDHIYLFKHPQEVFELIAQAGLHVKEHTYFMANDYSLEKALRFKNAILMVLVLRA
ncbi:class I SAM-dependent methyltransferase [Helicobacter cynogastricus]|uniref:class I SAM-dependent methyltransferase n=1 Tax=Helicobacter cynogastricus TaxID=329937 RepID=UPI000CF0871B|nr:class I SAM-dependent methyltransferase [Helicobacter cynogastricus]